MRFLQAGDFHLDSAFGALSPEKAVARRQEGRALVEKLATYVNDNQIDLVLLPGDLFDSNQPFSQTGVALAKALGQMKAQVVIAPGNHDCCSGNSPYLTMQWPANVHVFKKNTMETLDFPQWNVTVSGAGFTREDQVDSLLEGWSAPQDGRVHFGVLHGEIQPAQPRYNPLTKEQIAQSGLHYLALGHIHKRSKPTAYGQTLCVMAGCLEGHGFDELGEKGFYVGTVTNGGVEQVNFIPFAHRRHEIVTVDVSGQSPLEAIQKAIPEAMENHLCRIVLTGAVEETGVNMATLHQALCHRFYHLELRDNTVLTQDVWARAGEDSLSGLFLKELQTTKAKTQEEQHILTLAARYGLAALENRDMI